MRMAVLAGLTALGMCACGAGSSSTSVLATPTSTVASTPTATPGPDVQRVDVTATGVGAYMLVAIPVTILHNAASRSAALGVVVHFDVSRRGARIFSLDSAAVMLFPGQTLVVAANCTDTCDNADAATPTVNVSRWAPVGGSPIGTDAGAYTCGAGCGGHGYGSVATTLHGEQLVTNKPVDLFAACTDAAGTIVGGGQRQLTWPQNGGSLGVTVPVILSAAPTGCQVSASPPSSTQG